MHLRTKENTSHQGNVCCVARPCRLVGYSIAWLVACLVAGGQTAWAMPVASDATAPDRELEREPSWAIPTQSDIRQRMLAWLDAVVAAGRAPADSGMAARAMWPQEEEAFVPADLLDHVLQTAAMVDDRCASLLKNTAATDTAWLSETNHANQANHASDGFVRDAARLWLGRECVRHDRFDDGLALLADLDVSTAVDPATLLFHRAACQHWLLESDVAVESLDRLLERSGEIPVRYERVARLLRADIAALEDESLDHISRRMRDVTRRLDLGRAGPKTLAVQDGVIASLDKMIKAIEQQQQQNQSQSSGGAGGGGRSGNGPPMDDSRIAGGKGPGEVTKRDLGAADRWGNLPPHKREEALQQIGREFPSHYREAIEQYFKRLASGEESKE